MHAFEVLACGNPSHNLEVVCAPKPTTITQLLAMGIFSQSTSLCVCDARVLVSVALSFETCFSRPRSLQTSPQTSTTAGPSGADRGPGCTACNIMAGILIFLPPLNANVSPDGYHSLHSTGFDSSWGCCNCNKYIWCQASLHHVPLFSQLCLLSLFFPPMMRFLIMSYLNLWSSDMKALLLKSSIITSLCYVPRECASHIFFTGRALAPASSIFTLWFSP